MSQIFRGYNVNFFFNDVIDKDTALLNIGLNPDDVDVINGISRGNDGLDVNEFRTISGLTSDIQKELISIEFSGRDIEQLLNTSNKVDYLNRSFDLTLQGNLDIDDQLRAGAVKYKFLDYADETVKTADISTSRVSSWSSTESPATSTSPIFYGGKVEVSGNTLALTDLETTSAPIPKRYTSEVATDKLTLNLNGIDKNFYVMRDIPLTFFGFFRNATFRHLVDELPISGEGGQIRPVWKVTNLNDPTDFLETATVVSGSDPEIYRGTVGLDSAFSFKDARGRSAPRRVEFYYHPDYIRELEFRGIGLTELPLAKLPNLEKLDVSFNNLTTLPPLFGDLAPNLEELYLQLNPFQSVSGTGTVNSTLNNFFSKTDSSYMPIRILNLSSTFTGDENIDLTGLTSLEDFTWTTDEFNVGRRMGGSQGTIFPRVNSSTIRNYIVGNHFYALLPFEVNNATNLSRVVVRGSNLRGWIDNSQVEQSPLTFANSNTSIIELNFSTRASLELVDVSEFTALQIYEHQFARNAGSISGKFSGGSGLTNLERVSLYDSDVTGNIGGAFSNKPSLTELDLRRTALGPEGFSDTEFSGSGNLRIIRIERGNFNTTNFFGNTNGVGTSRCFDGTNLEIFELSNNKNIEGELPNFNVVRSLRNLRIRNTGLSGTIQGVFSFNSDLQILHLENNNFSGQVPGFNFVSLRQIRLENNNFSFTLPEQQVRNCTLFNVSNNNIGGIIPSFAGCPSIQFLDLSRNLFNGYTPTSLSALTNLRSLNISNCSLNAASIEDILSDLIVNYQGRNRIGVEINLLANSASETDLSENGLTLLSTVRGFGWTVLL